MAVPTLGLTNQQLIIRVAEYLGVASYSSTAGIPSDAHDLELCQRLVNDGIRAFLTSFHDWSFLKRSVTITFVAGTAEYDMPDGFYGELVAPFTYGSSGPFARVNVTHEAYIREANAAGTITGDPCLVAFYSGANTNATGAPRWKALFYPTPAGVNTVSARCSIFPDALTTAALSERHIAGFQHDETVMAFIMREAERQRNDTTGIHNQHAAECLQKSLVLDRRLNPRRLGQMRDGSEDRGDGGSKGWYTGVDTVRGTPV